MSMCNLVRLSWRSDTQCPPYIPQHPSEYGYLWEPTLADGRRIKIHIPRMIALLLWAASLYHQFKGAVMPQELLNAIKQHLASPDTSLDNGDDWGLVQKWLLMAAQKDGGGGDISKYKSHLAFRTATLLSNDDLIHRWITERLDYIGKASRVREHDRWESR